MRDESRRGGTRRRPRQQGHAATGQGRCSGPDRRRIPRSGRDHVRLERHDRTRGRQDADRRVVRRGGPRPRNGSGPSVPHRYPAARGIIERARSRHRRQTGAAGARRPRGIRSARSLCRAAGRAGSVARRIRRHRVAGWQGGHREVGTCSDSRPGGGAREAVPPQGRGVPAPLRRRRSGTGLPPGDRSREDEPWGQAVFDTLEGSRARR